MIRATLKILMFVVAISLASCSSNSESTPSSVPRGEYLYRHHNEELFSIEPMLSIKREDYPWQKKGESDHPKITKEFFRCKGNSSHPVKEVQKETGNLYYYDCGGTHRHGLPLRDQKEFIYPILIDVLNYVQVKTNKRVIVTCGHCCPEHNMYVDSSSANQTTKHLIGAEVDFYVQGLESDPERIVNLIQQYYQECSKYQGMADYTTFKRYEGEGTNVSIQPWFNKEIFVKLVKRGEGRDFDNRHPYAYITIQVRYDWDKQEKVIYTWDKAFRNFHRS